MDASANGQRTTSNAPCINSAYIVRFLNENGLLLGKAHLVFDVIQKFMNCVYASAFVRMLQPEKNALLKTLNTMHRHTLIVIITNLTFWPFFFILFFSGDNLVSIKIYVNISV